MKQIFNETASPNSEQVATLKSHFPQCFDKHGAFMPEKMVEIMREGGVEMSQEHYHLDWLGKTYARLLANEPPRTFLSAMREHNQQPENSHSENLLIRGDNLEVLKHLVNAYRESVKMIYIDPPYNTGSDGFVYHDSRKFTVEELTQLAGLREAEVERILKFTASKSNSHSAWLTFMYPRLYIARKLLREDGVIFMSIDDNEQAQLKLLCDEVFGDAGFVATFPWRKRTAKSDVPFGTSQDFEWVMCYANPLYLAGIAHERTYYQSDDYPKDRWRLSDLTTQRSAEERPNSAFDLLDPKTGKSYAVNPKRAWGVTKNSFADYYAKGKIVFPDDYPFLNISIPAYRVFESEDKAKAMKKYGHDGSIKAATTLLPKEVGMNEIGNKDIGLLFHEKLFSYPKPVNLIRHLIEIVNSADDCLILDFFAGSGTTAHAVMQLNAEDGGNRKFICVQLDEATDKKSEAYKAGYHSIYDITVERIRRASAAIQAELAEKLNHDAPTLMGEVRTNINTPADFGFKQFSTIPIFVGYNQNMETLEEGQVLFDPFKLTEEERQDLMLTWQAWDGIPLSQTLTPVNLAGYTAYCGVSLRSGQVLYFMHQGFKSEGVAVFFAKLDTDPDFQVRRLVVLSSVLGDTVQKEWQDAIRYHNNGNIKDIELILDIRD